MSHDPTLVPAVLPLALLQAVRDLDTPVADGHDEYPDDLSRKRFGMSATVASQIERFERLARDAAAVDADQLVQLFRLVGRRTDAPLVFSEAGRRAGRLAVADARHLFLAVLPARARRRAAFRAAQQHARRIFGLALDEPDSPHAVLDSRLPVEATADGAACGFYGAGVAELLRRFVDFEGAMMHIHCRARGDAACEWRAASPALREETA